MEKLRSLRSRLIIFLAVLGPGVITAMADNDAGGVATNVVLGAKFGYSMLFFLLIIVILLAVTQEMGARLSVITGQGLGDLIRERYGIRVSLFVFFVLFIANIGTTITNFAGLTAAAHLFNIPQIPALAFFVLIMLIMISRASYHTNQKLFLLIGILYITYIFSALFAKPDWTLALRSSIVPIGLSFSKETVLAIMALLGTTVTPWGQFFISSFVNDKKLTLQRLKYEQLEIALGSFLVAFFGFFMMIATAATLHKVGIKLDTAADAAVAIVPFAGKFAGLLFGLGLIGASYMGAVIVPLTTAYAFSEFFGFEGSLDSPIHESRFFYILFFIQIFIASVTVLLPFISLFKIVLITQTLNAVLLPVILFFVLKFCNDREIMETHINGPIANYIAKFAMTLIIIASAFIFFSGVAELI